MEEIKANVSKPANVFRSKYEKRILIDEDLIRHGYALHFVEFFEYLLQMTREISHAEEKANPSRIGTFFRITHIKIRYGSNIRFHQDFSEYMELYPEDVDERWVRETAKYVTNPIKASIPEEDTTRYLISSTKRFSDAYFIQHDEWDDIPSNILGEGCFVDLLQGKNLADSIIEIQIQYEAMFRVRNDGIKGMLHSTKMEKLQKRAKSYFQTLLDREVGADRITHLDRFMLCDFIESQQLFENDDAAQIIGREFLKMMKSAEEKVSQRT